MKIFMFMLSMASSYLCFAGTGSWDDVVRLYSKHNIDQNEYSHLNNLHISEWPRLTSAQKLLASKGTLITSLYESAHAAETLNVHANRLIRCMDTDQHGVTNHKNSLLQFGLMECAYKSR